LNRCKMNGDYKKGNTGIHFHSVLESFRQTHSAEVDKRWIRFTHAAMSCQLFFSRKKAHNNLINGKADIHDGSDVFLER
jgi:hypothetical protein